VGRFGHLVGDLGFDGPRDATTAILNATDQFSNGSAVAAGRSLPAIAVGFCEFTDVRGGRNLSHRERFATFLLGVVQRETVGPVTCADRFVLRKM
jgi:hypothetical protein